MTTTRKPGFFSAIAVVGILLFQLGACSIAGKPQKIPVTSDPAGARIFVDGKEAGAAPLNLSLKREEGHVVRIEKAGFVPVEIKLESETKHLSKFQQGLVVALSIPIGGVVVGLLTGGLSGAGHTHQAFGIGFLVGGVLAPIGTIFLIKRSNHPQLSPGEIKVILDEARGQAMASVIVVDHEQWQGLRWIRISCAEGGADDVVAVN